MAVTSADHLGANVGAAFPMTVLLAHVAYGELLGRLSSGAPVEPPTIFSRFLDAFRRSAR